MNREFDLPEGTEPLDNIVELGPNTNMTVEQALGYTVREATDGWLKEVLIVGINEENKLVIRSSGMSRERSNFLLDRAKLHSLSVI